MLIRPRTVIRDAGLEVARIARSAWGDCAAVMRRRVSTAGGRATLPLIGLEVARNGPASLARRRLPLASGGGPRPATAAEPSAGASRGPASNPAERGGRDPDVTRCPGAPCPRVEGGCGPAPALAVLPQRLPTAGQPPPRKHRLREEGPDAYAERGRAGGGGGGGGAGGGGGGGVSHRRQTSGALDM
jgi:hypothetical protein